MVAMELFKGIKWNLSTRVLYAYILKRRKQVSNAIVVFEKVPSNVILKLIMYVLAGYSCMKYPFWNFYQLRILYLNILLVVYCYICYCQGIVVICTKQRCRWWMSMLFRLRLRGFGKELYELGGGMAVTMEFFLEMSLDKVSFYVSM